MIDPDLVPLPAQHAGVPWPTLEWPTDAPGPEVDGDALHALVDRAMGAPDLDDLDDLGETRAVVVVHRGRLVLERHADGYGPTHTHPSWSLAKSILHAAVGIAVRDGLLEPAEPVDAPEWPAGDPRHAITIGDLLAMRCGLAWQEVYLPGVRSDVIDMLWGAGKDDIAAFVASKPLVAEPGSDEAFVYSSGTSNLLSRLLGDRIVAATCDAGEAPTGEARAEVVLGWLREQLLEPIGMTSAAPKADPAGTWVASSYCFATAADLARFGLFALHGGTWDGRDVLPPGWMDRARTPRSVDVDTAPDRHGEHWWTSGSTPGAFFGSGYEGQRIWVAPAQDLVVVRLGVTDVALRPNLQRWLDDLTACFPAIDPI